jgi:hypothetical protein
VGEVPEVQRQCSAFELRGPWATSPGLAWVGQTPAIGCRTGLFAKSRALYLGKFGPVRPYVPRPAKRILQQFSHTSHIMQGIA